MLPIGTRIFYTGDMANLEGRGAIVAFHEADRFSPDQYDIQMDDGRIFKGIGDYMFQPHVGRRFMLLSEYDAQRNEAIERLKAIMAAARN